MTATLHGRFEARVAADPHRIALTDGARRLSYADLDARAEALASRLRAAGVRPGDLVATCLARSAELMVSIIAILKAGAAYVPLDPDYPEQRLEFLLADSSAVTVVTDTAHAAKLGVEHRVLIDGPGGPGHDTVRSGGTRHKDCAYVIYTSGSTGAPKGVLVSHANVIALMDATAPVAGITESDVWTLFHSVSFDFSVWEMWGALLYGGRLVIVHSRHTKSLEDFVGLLRDERVTVLNQVPSVFRHLVAAFDRLSCPVLALRAVIFGGEALDPASVQRFWRLNRGPHVRMINMYGITEATVHVTFCELTDEVLNPGGDGTPIGVPLPHLEVHLVDECGEPVPDGEPGEIWVGGAGVAWGYLGRPKFTAERFLRGGTVYRSGDLARRDPDGGLHYLGRIDHQVKVRGFRIEPAEIEAVIREFPGAEGAAVVAHDSAQGGRRLVAYVEPALEGVHSLREFVAGRLPAHMTPAQFIVMARLPISPNGKLDRRALPDPDRQDTGPAPCAATTPLERMLVEVWSEVLGLDPYELGIDQNFFVSGGDSLNSIQISVAVEERGHTATLEKIFRHQTIRTLAAAMAEQEGAPDQAGAERELPPFALVSDVDRARLGANIIDAYPMTMLQQGMLIESMLGATAGRYHDIMLTACGLPLVPELLDRALADLFVAHPTLRTSFDIESYAEPLGLVHAHAETRVQIIDLLGFDSAMQDRAVKQWVDGAKARPMSWQIAPLVRVAAFAVDRASFRLAVGFHHAILDGYSFTMLLSELLRRYADLLRHGTAAAPVVEPVRFAEYVARERAAIAEPAERQWWLERLCGYRPLLPSTDDGPQWYHRRVVHFDSEASRGLREVSAREGASVKHLVLAAHLWVLGQFFGRVDVTTGLVTNGRPRDASATELLGLFLNTVPLRVELGHPTWRDLVREVSAADVESQEHRLYPYAQMVRDIGITPIQTSFNFLRYVEYNRLEEEGVPLLIDEFHVQTEFPFSLNAEVDPKTDELSLDIWIDGDRWPEEEATRVAELYRRAIGAMVADIAGACPPVQPRQSEAGTAARALGVAPEHVVAVGPLTEMQLDLYLYQARKPERAHYFLAFHLPLGRELRPEVWRRAVAEVVRLEEGLRTRLWETADGTTHWCVLACEAVLEEISADDLEKLIDAVREPFPLLGSPLVRHYLARDPDGEYHAVLATHHIALDRISGVVVLRSILDAYHSILEGRLVEGPGASFRDFVASPDARMDAPDSVDYWRRQAEVASPLMMPRPAVGAAGRVVDRAVLSTADVERLRTWCAEHSVRLPKLILAAYLATLWRVGEPDGPFVVDHVVAGRPAGHRDTVGCFYRVAPFVVDLAADRDRASWVMEVERERSSHARLSVRAQRAIFPAQSPRFVYNAYTSGTIGGSRMRLVNDEPLDEAHLVVEEVDGELDLSFRYREDQLAGFALPTLVARVALALIEPGTVGSIPLVSEEERGELLRLADGGPILHRDGALLHDLIRAQAGRTPHAEAVRIGDTALSYQELMGGADRLAARLVELGVGPDDRVAVALPRSLELMVSLLAVLRAGAGYVPLDTGYPEARLSYMLADSGASVVLADASSDLPLPAGVVRCGPTEVGAALLPELADPTLLAYMIYTSGSTGRPKGAMNQHGAVVNRLEWMRNALDVTDVDVVLQKTPNSFDVSVWEFFLPLLTGARLVFAAPGRHGDPFYLADLIESVGITMVHFVPSMLRVFLDAMEPGRCVGLRCVVSSGEALPPQLRDRFRRLLPGVRLVNLYGPTEAAVDVTVHYCADEPLATVPIGRPIAGTRTYLLDRDLRLVPRGAVGELCLGGIQVGRGYGGRPDLTADRFVPDEFVGGGRLYRTGDRARWLPNGELEYLGRNDDQVKLRGFRIETDEVTAALRELAEIADATVLLTESAGGRPMLVAYLVPAPGATVDWPSVGRALRLCLPEHSVPTGHVVLDAMPLTPNGKVNRAALRAMDPVRAHETHAEGAPCSSTEERLVQVWRDVLHLDALGVEDNFFDLGGDSLLLLRTLGRVRAVAEAGTELSVVDLFSHPTIRTLAAYLDRLNTSERATTGTRRGGRTAREGRLSEQRERRLAGRRLADRPSDSTS
ncbi:non-ribosomal peptide synthetase [Nonomuraea cypriaca]|nr:non-ribosomal peptide synthetase [Nonomuraea cypriaca]